jgi:hypothetical protein
VKPPAGPADPAGAAEPAEPAESGPAAKRRAPAAPTAAPTAPAGSPATPSATRPPADPTVPSAGLDQLRARWPEIVAHLSAHPPTKPLIAACRPISVEGNIVTLGFPEGQAFLKDVAERRRTNLEDGIGQFLGRAVAVRCVATNLDLVPTLPGDEEAAYVLAEARRIFADDLADVGEVN